MSIDRDDWRLKVTRATWMKPNRWTALEEELLSALDRLVQHDNADSVRRDAPHCIELQYAIEILNREAGSELFKIRY